LAPCTQLALKQGEGVDARTQLALGGGLVVLLLTGGAVDRLQTGELEERGGGGPLCSSPACHNQLARWICHKIRVWMMNTKRSDVIGQWNWLF